MKQTNNRNIFSAVLAGFAVLLLGLAPVSAEPALSQVPAAASSAIPLAAPASSPEPVERTFAEPVPLTAADAAFEPPKPQLALPPGAIALEIRVTAIVPPMRHIVVDATGSITQITSNTLEDIEPEVYQSDVKPGNQRPLTDEIYQLYRSAVPIGTAARGILYEQGIPLAATSGRPISAGIINSGRN